MVAGCGACGRRSALASADAPCKGDDAAGLSGNHRAVHCGIRLGSGPAAHAREEEQRSQCTAARLDRVRSALTQVVNAVVGKNSIFIRCCKRKQAVNCRI